MNKYTEMKNRHQEDVNQLPLRFAFSNKQFEEMMAKWGLSPADTDKICSIGAGGYIQKEDQSLLCQTLERHSEERDAAIAEDKTGEGFIYEMFLTELSDHEYGYTGNPEETLDALGYTWEQVQEDPRLLRGFEKAHIRIMEAA